MSQHHKAVRFSTYSKRYRPSIAKTLPAPCVNRCTRGGIVHPDQPWDVAHIVDAAEGGGNERNNFGAAHRGCNRSDGGKKGAAITNRGKAASTAEGKRIREW
jgi:5-methylcytosine-specific restriction endonuclease McrA